MATIKKPVPIPLTSEVYRRIPPDKRQGRTPSPDAFVNTGPERIAGKGPGMSVNWADMVSAVDTQQTANHKSIPADAFGVISLKVAEIHQIPNQEAFHLPSSTNPAHSSVTGEKDLEIQAKYIRISDWAIFPDID